MAQFRIATKPATKSFTDGVPFITLSYGRQNDEYNVRTFEATKLEQIKSEVTAQESMAQGPSVTNVTKVSGRAPSGFNEWDKKNHFFDPNEVKQTA